MGEKRKGEFGVKRRRPGQQGAGGGETERHWESRRRTELEKTQALGN